MERSAFGELVRRYRVAAGLSQEGLAERSELSVRGFSDTFGQLPDTREAAWIDVARRNEPDADRRIEELPEKQPFLDKYDRIPENVDWESCSTVLDAQTQLDALMRAWDGRQM